VTRIDIVTLKISQKLVKFRRKLPINPLLVLVPVGYTHLENS